MQRKTKILAAMAAAGLLTLGGLAGLASADMGDGEGMMGGMGKGPRAMRLHQFHGMGSETMMERYDTNKDGKITQPEIDQNRQQWLVEFDADKNGTLSLEEFKQLWLKARNEMMVREFQFFDKDGNGQVTIEEYQAPLSNMVAERDANNDGSLGPDDRPMMGQHQGQGHQWRHGMGHGQGHGMGYGQGHGWGNGGGETGDAPSAGQQPEAEGQANP